jgi:hypothetical protein
VPKLQNINTSNKKAGRLTSAKKDNSVARSFNGEGQSLQVFASEGKIRSVYEEKLTGDIETRHCISILHSIIKKEDVCKLEECIFAGSDKKSGKIAFVRFEKIVLDFFLSQHEAFLTKVRQIWKSLDADDDGLLTHQELANTLGYIDPMNELKIDKTEFQGLCDQFETGSVTFSKFVQVLSGIRVTVDQRDSAEDGRSHKKEMSVIQFTLL